MKTEQTDTDQTIPADIVTDLPPNVLAKLDGPRRQIVNILLAFKRPQKPVVISGVAGKSYSWTNHYTADIRSALERSGYTLVRRDDASIYIARYAAPPTVRKPVIAPDLGSQAAIDRASEKANMKVQAEAPKPTPDVASVSSEPATVPAETETPARPASEPWHRHVFVFPWGGCIVLNAVVAAYVERDCLVIQLSKGGFTRSPAHPRAAQVCEAIVEALLELPHSKRIDASL